jgi:hypothetical protein
MKPFSTSALKVLTLIFAQACWPADLPTGRPTRLPQDDQRLGFPSLPRPAIGDSGGYVVLEYQPVGHRPGRFSWTVESTPNASKIEALYQFDNPFSNQIDSRAIVL